VTATQAIGGAIVLAGLALARQGDRSEEISHSTTVTWPDAAVTDLSPAKCD
jgi:hypothetical protein